MKHCFPKKDEAAALTIHTDHIAVLLAAYNGEKYIAQQLDSLIAQTFPDWELFIHDDGSCDATPVILKKYAAAYPERIHIIEAPPQGSAKGNFFFLMRQIDAPYLMFCDQDDVWNTDKIECSLSALKALEAQKGADVPMMAFSDSTVVDEELRVISESFLSYQNLDPTKLRFPELMVQNVVPGNTAMFNRALLQYARKCSDAEVIIMHDWWCALAAAYFGEIVFINKSTLLYRQHKDSLLGAKKYMEWKYPLDILKCPGRIRDSFLTTRTQAGEFAKAFGLGEDSLPACYSARDAMNKWQRLRFYRKNDICKTGLCRNIGFYFFG